MMKFPSASAGGTAPSGSSLAVTNPGVFGSRVGGVGRAGRVAGMDRVVAGLAFWAAAGSWVARMRLTKKQKITAVVRIGVLCCSLRAGAGAIIRIPRL
jgi:hypothetical protein